MLDPLGPIRALDSSTPVTSFGTLILMNHSRPIYCARQSLTRRKCMSIEDNFKISLNQNLWGLLVGYVALGAAEHWNLTWLFRLSVVISLGMTISVLVTAAAYTRNYCRDKWGRD